ncbi:DUF3971 domain-containing protein [Temperatibacter marinus]|uniref:DUF3971 domain-containing protein n=1 Tax=Temperatibacter marinus TaxID=1456591 RepID=A0AA52HA67_9PROT|nr:DUF3971 domain-containing protein [Temperatibacter marinus]WND02273.1 DUF3971 domain-containing protein [Temperatibacter marinus]
MVKKAASIFARSMVWFSTIALALFLLLIARIIYAPLDVTFARDFVKEQAALILPGWQVNFESANIKWDWSRVRLQVSVEKLFLIDRLDRLRADFPSTQLDISRSLLYTGSVKLINFDSKNVVITITDLDGFSDDSQRSVESKLSPDSKLSEHHQEAGATREDAKMALLGPNSFKPLTEGMTRFSRRLLQQQSQLETLNVDNFHLLINAGEAGVPVNMHFTTLNVSHQDGLINFKADGSTDLGDLPAKLRMTGDLDPEEGVLTTNVGLTNIVLSELAESFDLPEILKAMKFPVSSDTVLLSSLNKGLEQATMRLALDEGEIYHPYHFPERGKILEGTLSVEFDPEKLQMKITEGDFHLFQGTDFRAKATGLLYWEDGNPIPGLKLRTTAKQASIEHVKAFWPVMTSKRTGKPQAGRTWVADNIKKIKASNLEFLIDRSPNGIGSFKDGSILELRFGAIDTEVRFMKTMPHLKDVALTSVLTQTDIEISLLGGQVNEMPVKGSRAYIDWSRKTSPDTLAEFTIQSQGSVQEVFDIISLPPLSLTQKFGMDPKRINGETSSTTTITLPLVLKIPKEAIKVKTTATIQKASVDEILGGEGLRDGELELTVTNDDLFIEGSGRLNGLDVNFSWLEDFKALRNSPDALTSRTVLSGEFEAHELSAFGINNLDDFAEGKMPAEATFLGRAFAFTEGYFSADATPATLKLPLLAWNKPIGRVANINGAIQFGEDAITLAPLAITGEDIDIAIRVDWDKRNAFDSGSLPFKAVIHANQLDEHALVASLSNEKEGHLRADIEGSQIDLNDLLTGRRVESQEGGSGSTGFETIETMVKVDRVLLKNGVILNDIRADLLMDKGDPDLLSLEAIDKDGFKITGTIQERQTKGRGKKRREMNPMSLKTENGGELLKGLGIFAHGQQGLLDFNGEIMGWKGADFNVSGAFKISDMRVVRKSELGPEVKHAVLEGINEFVDEGGLLMKKARGSFTFKDTILDISSFKANSSNLGITLSGQYEDTTRRINMNGVVVPAYGLNSFLGNIPLVGAILTGGKGKGIFGVTYRLKGQGSGAKFSVNPLSAVTPGFLRNIFEGSKGLVKNVKIEKTQEEMAEEDKKLQEEKEKKDQIK